MLLKLVNFFVDYFRFGDIIEIHLLGFIHMRWIE